MKRTIKQISLILVAILTTLNLTAQSYRSFTTDKVAFNSTGTYYTLPKYKKTNDYLPIMLI